MSDDLQRRAKAAAALADIEQEELAERLEMSYATLVRRLKKERWRRHEREAFLQGLAKACGLPYEFFTVDFARIGELAEESQMAPALREALGLLREAADEVASALDDIKEDDGDLDAAQDAVEPLEQEDEQETQTDEQPGNHRREPRRGRGAQ